MLLPTRKAQRKILAKYEAFLAEARAAKGLPAKS